MIEHFNIIDRLHTDVLEDKYGKITAKVLRHNSSIREAHLIDGDGISRTFAITIFPKVKDKEIKFIDDKIRKGAPIGKAFREKGYAIRKNVIDVFIVKIPSWLKKDFKTKDDYAKARLSEFYACKGNKKPKIYGTVTEIYSPDFREASINNADIMQMNPSTKEFVKVGITMEDVWKRLGQDNYWTDERDRFMRAKKKSLDYVYRLKKSIRNHLEEAKKIK